MNRAFWSAGILVAFVVAAGAQEAEEGLRPALPEDAAIEPQVLTTQTPLSIDEPQRRPRREDTSEQRLGIGNAPLRLFSQIEIGAAFTTNADRARGGEGSDVGVIAAPELRLQSNWPRHAWTATAAAELSYFAGENRLRVDAVTLANALRLDVRRTTTIDFDSGLTLSTPLSDASRQELEATSGAAITHDFGGLEARLRAGASYLRANGGGDGSYIQPEVSARVTVATSPALRPFVEAAYTPRIFESAPDTQGGSLALGLAIDNEPFVTGAIAAVYTVRGQDSLAGAFGLRGDLAWTPSDFTTISATADVEIEDDGTRQWSLGLAAAYALTDDISLFGGTQAVFTGAEDADASSIVTASNLGIARRFTENFAAQLRYENTVFLKAAGEDSDEYRIIASIILRR